MSGCVLLELIARTTGTHRGRWMNIEIAKADAAKGGRAEPWQPFKEVPCEWGQATQISSRMAAHQVT